MAKRWTEEEKTQLVNLVMTLGPDWDSIGGLMGKTKKAVASEYYRMLHSTVSPRILEVAAPTVQAALGTASEFGGPAQYQPHRIAVRSGERGKTVSITMKPVAEGSYVVWRRLFHEMLKEIRSQARPRQIKRSWPTGRRSGLLAELAPFDAHIGKLIWGQGVGDKRQDYDVDIASRRYIQHVFAMLERVAPYRPEKIVLIVGNDFFNINSVEMETANGTPQKTEDSRLHRTWRFAKEAIVQCVDACLSLGPTQVLFVPGNHERERLFYFGEMISALYSKTPGVTIDNAPSVRKYIRWGKNLIMLTHGNEEKIDSLPLVMAAERREDWGQTIFHEAHIGHFHRKRAWKYMPIEEIGGVIVRALPSLTNTDEWHYLKGYVGNVKASEALLFHKRTGPFAVFTVTV
ncbi:MAG: SANT/Myb-like DNA-binding domain-containing protein [Candidatus Caldarchaeum sp.]